MPERKTIEKAEQDKKEGKSPSTQAGEFVREEIDHVREGKHGVRSTKQAIAIGLSKARRAGVELPPPEGKTSDETRNKADRDLEAGKAHVGRVSRKRSRATTRALQREPRKPATRAAISRQAHSAANQRSAASRSAAARRAAATKGAAGRSAAARKAARTRARHAAR
jgi:Family of unknown function (DUF6496)